MEEWRDVADFEGLYQISSQGDVKAYPVGGRKRAVQKKKFLPDGRQRIYLFKDGHRYFKLISRLVADTFIPNPENKPQVDHINHVVSDNRVENLRWATIGENNANRKPTRLLPKGVYKRRKNFQAYSHLKGKTVYLGTYDNIEDASNAVIKYSRGLYGDFYLGGSLT